MERARSESETDTPPDDDGGSEERAKDRI